MTTDQIHFFFQVDPNSTLKELKTQIHRLKSHLYPDRQEFRQEPRGKGLDENKTVAAIGLKDKSKLYLKVFNLLHYIHSTPF